MKLSAALLFFILSLSLKAQLSLEHSFNADNQNTFAEYFITDNGIQYYHYDKTTLAFTIYNVDYSIYKTIQLSVQSGHSVFLIYCVSNKLFNSDNLYEFILVTTDYMDYKMKLYNENNVMLKDFGNKFGAGVIQHNGVSKLMVRGFTSNDIYSVPGSIPTGLSGKSDYNANAFPNPASNCITLPYTLHPGNKATLKVFSADGRLMDQKEINAVFNSIQLNVDNYPPGLYFYDYNGISHKFIVSK